jgi:tRNA-dihydrouridine synthase B
MRQTLNFTVNDVPVHGDVILAPMAGFSDVPHRALCRSHGSAMSYTEFVAVEEILFGGERVKRLLDYVEEDRPVVFQIFGNDPQMILRAAQRLEGLGPDIIDVNMGCSTRRVSGRGAGVGMMQQPKVVAETFHLLSRQLSVPITAKIRLGWEDNQNYLEIGHILEDNGAALIAIHPRTKEQKYSGLADWDAIAELKQAVRLPVIGNGDIRSPADIDRMKAYTDCDAVMIGRGALGNPWIFGRVHKAILPLSEITQTVRIHLGAMLSYYGEYGLVLFRKYLKRYLLDLPAARPFYRQLVVVQDSAIFLRVLSDMEQALVGRAGAPRPSREVPVLSRFPG